MPFTPRICLLVCVAAVAVAKYAGSLTAAAASPELSAVNKAGERWLLPISIVLRFQAIVPGG